MCPKMNKETINYTVFPRVALLFALFFLTSFAVNQEESVVTVYLIGDSTMSDKLPEAAPETGWGMPFASFFNGQVKVDNRARNGRSTKTFIGENRWQSVEESLRPGDYVFIQFGHNDESESKPERYTPVKDYKKNLEKFITETRAKNAIPVLLTPVTRRRFDSDGNVRETHPGYSEAVMEVAKKLKVPAIDLDSRSRKLLSDYGEEGSKQLFLQLKEGEHPNYPQGITDNTHFSPLGAYEVARLVAEGIRENGLELAEWLSPYHFVVAADGTGHFATVQEAINAVPDFRANRTLIYIKNGVYKEKLTLPATKTNVSLIGESAESTILTFDDYASRRNRFGEEIGTTGSASFFVNGDGFVAKNITFENAAGPVGQAVAVRIDGDKVVFENCRFLGFQDTLYPHSEKSRQYYKNCYIEGTVDFIFGWSTAVFEDCEIFCKDRHNGYVTAASTLEETPYGFVFINCKITGNAPEGAYYLGRPWRPYAKTVFIDCHIGAHIKPEGWHNWRKPEAEKTAFYAEYNSTGPGANASQRVPWSHQLSDAQRQDYTLEKIFGDWKIDRKDGNME